ncbi:MAG: Smr/MutS family protein [Alphaproteobacteria bacterium]
MARNKSRELTAQERTLWQKVASTATPMAHRSRQDRLRDGVAPQALAPDQNQPFRATAPRAIDVPPAFELPSPAVPVGGQSPSGLDRRTGQRLRRGQIEADATIDLHGLTQARAHRTLARFIREAQARGHRLVLVITGKGKLEADPVDTHHRGQRGVLRHAVPQWLSARDLSEYVVGYQRAHQRHGGDGALYVRIRRQK